MKNDKQTFESNYKIFANFLGDMVMCNNIPEIDPSVYENARFNWVEEVEEEDGETYERETEVYQWFLLSANDWEIELAEKNFPDALFTYSDKLDLFVLCVDHWGTPWQSVYFETTEECFKVGGPWDK